MEPYKLVSIIWMASTIYQVAADTEILLKVPKGKTWAWYISPHSTSDGAGWNSPSRHNLIYSVCDIQSNTEPKNWLRTGFIPLNNAKLLEIKMGYRLKNCPDDSTIRHCKTYLDIYALHTNKTLLTDDSDPGLVRYEFVDRITPGVKLEPGESKEFTYHGKFIAKAKGVYLAFLDQGVCIVLQNFTLGYKFCSEKGKDLVTFPRTVAPANDSQLEEKDGKCSDNHSVSEGKLSGVCLSSGEWNITDGVRCLCMKGYELVETEPNSLGCGECPKGSYKNMVNNEKCVECPANSSSDTAKTGCICNEGFYKLADEEPCTALPEAPTNASTTVVKATYVTINWTRSPDGNDTGNVRYSVDCFRCMPPTEKECKESCGPSIKYRPSKDNIRDVWVTVHGLQSDNIFQFRVYSVSELNQQEKDRDKWKYVTLRVRTKECPANSLSDTARTGCICNEGFYKLADEEPCTALPQAPPNASTTVVKATDVIIKWTRSPDDNDTGNLRYSVDCFRCMPPTEKECKESCGPSVKYTPSKDNITDVWVKVHGLQSDSIFQFRVYSVSELNQQEKDRDKWKYVTIRVRTKAKPTVKSRGANNIGTSEAKVPFNNKETLSSGEPVSYFQMIVTRLKEGQDPGNSSDPAYESVTRNYETRKDGEPYITAEFSRGAVETEFPVGDEKYYSRNGVTDSKRKRRDTTDIIKYRNGKLDDNTKYAVFQRSFASDGEYENEGFIEFTTKKDNTALIVTGVLVPLVIVAVIAVIILIYRRRSVFGLHIGMVTLRNQQTKERNQQIERNLKKPLLTHGSRVRTARDIQHLDASEIPPIRTECIEELGRGAFGKVKKAKLKDGLQYFVEAQDWANLKRKEKIVAVKQLYENANDEQRKEFLDEIELMKEVGKHPNVLSFLGCWTTTKPLQLVIEYIPHGDLLHWLRSKRSQLRGSTMGAGLVGPKDTEFYAGTREQKTTSDKDSEADQTKTNKCIVEIPMIAFSSSNQEGDPPAQKNDDECDEDCDSFDSSDLLKFAWQIARGMSYLSEKGLVHRDLAARNILMGHSKRLKIGDFGLMRQLYREVYEGKKQKKLPIKWMAPEAIFDEIFSVKSDVWSYGVVMWEIGTLGGSPYPLLNHTQMLRRLKRGYRMEKPDICSDTFYTLMRDCWNQIPDERPSFEDLVERVEQMLLQEVEYVDISKLDESEDYYKVQESATAETESENELEQESAF